MRRAGIVLALLLTVLAPVSAQSFDFQDLQGQPQRLADYRGKWVLVNFWATWCPSCLEEIPDLVALHNAHKDRDLVVLGVAMESTRVSVNELAAKYNINYPLVMGDYRIAAQIGEVKVLPTSYLYAPNGELATYQAGGLTRKSVENYIKNKKFS